MNKKWLSYMFFGALGALIILIISNLFGYGPAIVSNDNPRVVLPWAKHQVVRRSALKSHPVYKSRKSVISRKLKPAIAAAPALPLALAPASALPVIPPAVPESERLTLRLNVVEWSPVFQGLSLVPRDIGPVIHQGLTAGTVRRTTVSVAFDVNGAEVVVKGGLTALDPGPIGPETSVSVTPLNGVKFALPPGAQFPLVIKPGELESLAQKGIKTVWLNFILAPR